MLNAAGPSKAVIHHWLKYRLQVRIECTTKQCRHVLVPFLAFGPMRVLRNTHNLNFRLENQNYAADIGYCKF